MYLCPSEIYYSQDTIGNSLQNSGDNIKQVVNDICAGRQSSGSIPTISVAKVDLKWVTANNRRLWVFKQLEKRGKIRKIPVRVIPSIRPSKMTTKNVGVSISLR